MTLEQRVAVLEEIFLKLRDYYMSTYSGEEIDALLASAGVPIGITKEYDSVSAMNDDFSSTDVTRGQFVLILTTDTSSEDYGKVYLKGSANWVYVFTLTSLTAIKGPQGPAGKRGAKGADGADGKNFMVLGYYETLSALNAAVPSPGTGDTYGVGTEPPYAFYMYDPTISNWRYVGNLQGPEGPVGGSSNFVRYDAAQSLTDAQKQQARGNIAAAPDGYGLGTTAVTLTASDDLDNVSGSGWYYWGSSIPANAPSLLHFDSTPGYCSMFIISDVQIVFSYNDRNNIAIRSKNNSGFIPWEYVNPALKPGVEYRTTERYLGKPVYIRLEEVAALPNNTTLTVSNVGVPSGGTLYVDNIVDYRAEFYSNSNVYSIPYNDVVDVPECNGSRYGNGITYSIRTKEVDYSDYAGRIWIKYTKQTD